MEHFSSGANVPFFIIFFKILTFQRRPKALVWSKGLSSHSKIHKTKVLKPCGSLMQVKSIAECPMRAFCNTFDLHKEIIGLENLFLGSSLSGHLRQVLM